MEKTSKENENIFDYKYKDWWNKSGNFKPLHKFNLIRIKYILRIIKRESRDMLSKDKPLENLNILDIGCGGGILSEPLTRLGGNVLGVDISKSAIKIAKDHAKKMNLDIEYQCIDIKHLVSKRKKFNVIIISEVIEHIDEREKFLYFVSKLGYKNALVLITTINKSFSGIIFGKFFAEYILDFIPKGTHDWKKFVSPITLKQEAKKTNIFLDDFTGISLNPFTNQFHLSPFLNINYAASGKIR